MCKIEFSGRRARATTILLTSRVLRNWDIMGLERMAHVLCCTVEYIVKWFSVLRRVFSGIILLKTDKLIRFIKCLPSTCFTKQVLGLLLRFHRQSFSETIEPWTSLHLLWIHSLSFKQKCLKFWLEIRNFFCYGVISNFDDT